MVNCPSLGAWYRQHGHDLHGITREDRKVRMLLEKFGGGLVRVRVDNHKSAHVIARILGPALRDLLGFPQWSAHGNNGGLMFLDPCLLVPSHGDRLREGRPRPRVGDYSCFQGTQRDRYCSCSRRLLSFARCGLEQRFNVMAQVVDARGRDSRVAPPPTFTSCWQKNPMFINVCWASPPQTEYAVKGALRRRRTGSSRS